MLFRSGLIKKLDLNLFNNHEYWPYFNGMKDVSSGAGKISVKATLDKDAYNELILMVDCILLNLVADYINNDKSGNTYFADLEKLGSGSDNLKNVNYGGTSRIILNMFNTFDNDYVKAGKSTEEKIKFIEPYIRSIPATLIKWVMRSMLEGSLSNVWNGTLGQENKGLLP